MNDDGNRRIGLRAVILTSVTMVAFAGNSVLCRMALHDGAIDPAGFTVIRFLSGALTLIAVLAWRGQRRAAANKARWGTALTLFLYAIAFSYAYVTLGAGTGALILFAFVQATMIAWSIWARSHPTAIEWAGWIVAAAGVVWLLLPGLSAPDPTGAVLMAVAGIAWGAYSLRGRNERAALAGTATNFLLCLAFIAGFALVTASSMEFSGPGIALAIVSGAVTSGLGYVAWYSALDYLSAMQGALVQLSVPALAMAGGVVLLDEPLTARLIVASTLVIGGLWLALWRGRGAA